MNSTIYRIYQSKIVLWRKDCDGYCPRGHSRSIPTIANLKLRPGEERLLTSHTPGMYAHYYTAVILDLTHCEPLIIKACVCNLIWRCVEGCGNIATQQADQTDCKRSRIASRGKIS